MKSTVRLSATLIFEVVAVDIFTDLDARTGDQRSIQMVLRSTDNDAFLGDGRPLSSIEGELTLSSLMGTSDEDLKTVVGYFEGWDRYPERYWATAPMSSDTLERIIRDCAFGMPQEVHLTVLDLEPVPTGDGREAWAWPTSDQNTCDIISVRVMTHIGGPTREERLLPERADP